MSKSFITIILILIIVFAGIWWYKSSHPKVETVTVSSFTECVKAGYSVSGVLPRTCTTSEGKVFTEATPPPTDKSNLIRVTFPQPNALITSPVTVTGEARGTWFFEASFPVKLLDANGKVLAQSPAQAQSDWQTPNFVPFKVTLTYSVPETATGTLVLMKDNPSDLPQNDDQIVIPVTFKRLSASVGAGCQVGGCSAELCGPAGGEPLISNCIYKAEFACYQTASCVKQANGLCGWTQTAALKQCIASNRSQ
ncbi:hypothetical protein KW783_00330 [Candidatus Parcubacteria bacterium]|nr:hypothetical protein [Candidatus Parcubacteria bacterium]